jgi:hypothetical protein
VPDKPSVAVLEFVNMSSDDEQEYFTDGITECRAPRHLAPWPSKPARIHGRRGHDARPARSSGSQHDQVTPCSVALFNLQAPFAYAPKVWV